MCFSTFKSLRCFASIFSVALFCSVAQADLLDQVNGAGAVDYTANSITDVGQSFTAGLSGQLTQVDVYVGRNAATTSDLMFDVRQMSGSLPTEADAGGNIVASFSRSAGDIPTTAGWQSFDVSGAGFNINSGDTLAIVLRNTDLSGYQWFGAGADPYAGGSTFLRVGVGTWGDDTFDKDVDLSFRTFVAVPEPSSALILASLAGIACVRRKRR